MSITKAPRGTTLAFWIWKSTGMAFSSSVPVQPPAPKLLGPPSITRPAPICCVLRTSMSICSSLKWTFSLVARGTLASTTVS